MALFLNAKQEVLWVYSGAWGAFSLPMSRLRRGSAGAEGPQQAILRAGSDTVGLPVRLVPGRRDRVVGHQVLSYREMRRRDYVFHVGQVEAHPDFAGRVAIRQPHLWLSPHLALAGVYEPMALSSRFVLRQLIADLGIPARVEKTSVVLIERQGSLGEREFLLRWSDTWGYMLPLQRQAADSAGDPARAAVQQALEEQLGLTVATDVRRLERQALPGGQGYEHRSFGVSPTAGTPAYHAPTNYVHALFRVELADPARLHADRQALIWARAGEVASGFAVADHPVPPHAASAGPISSTATEILEALAIVEQPPDIELLD